MFHKKSDGTFNRKIENQEYETLSKLFPTQLLNTVIRYQDGIVTKSSIDKQVIININTKVSDDYKALVNELIGGVDSE